MLQTSIYKSKQAMNLCDAYVIYMIFLQANIKVKFYGDPHICTSFP